MPLPKKRHSKARGRRRRTHWKIKGKNLMECPQCKKTKLQHRACASCGYYNGKKVLEIKVKEKKKKGS
ncbi:MAG: 50S ribosomal protein L32 [Candidatus Omnitrophota bacterium]|nr:50S ribosomal protein L32 [Candidatus Omnitrophota bacterium]